jgi:hypothetical protein
MASVTTHPSHAAPTPAPPNALAPILLVLVNAVPLVGVLLFDWRLFDLMLLYWLENGVIGAFTLAKIVTSRAAAQGAAAPGAPSGTMGKAFVAGFFALHYGMFWGVHGIFVFALFGASFGGGLVGVFGRTSLPFGGPGFGPPGLVDPGGAVAGTVALALLSLVVSHGVSFFTNYLGRGEDRMLTPTELMGQPYARVMVLHVSIIGGGIVVMMLGTPVAALLLLVALKTGIDLSAHRREHRAAAER